MDNENDDKPHYSHGTAAGWKGISREARQNSAGAAHEVNKTLGRRHRQMIDAWRIYGRSGAIPEQVANDLELPVHVVRPRCSELVKKGLLFELEKRPGGLGHKVMAYTVTPPVGDAA